MELNVDFTICKILRITPEQTHALVAGLHFGPKAALLRSLLPTSSFKNVSELKGFLTRITRESLRNVFTHSFIASDEHSVTFIHRKNQTIYSADTYKFEADDFCTHVKEFVKLAHDFEVALCISSNKRSWRICLVCDRRIGCERAPSGATPNGAPVQVSHVGVKFTPLLLICRFDNSSPGQFSLAYTPALPQNSNMKCDLARLGELDHVHGRRPGPTGSGIVPAARWRFDSACASSPVPTGILLLE